MQLSDKIRQYIKTENDLTVPFLELYCFEDREFAMPKTDKPYVYFFIDGDARLYTPSGIMDYSAGQYSVSEIDTPERGYVIAFSDNKDFLSASVCFTANEVLSVILELDDELVNAILDETLEEPFLDKQDTEVFNCLTRLLETTEKPIEQKFLSEQIHKEMIFHILCGSCGKHFIQSVTQIRDTSEIYEANSWIKENFRESFVVEELARQWNMSVSRFHQKFKNAVGMGPLQCQKRLRLTEARRLLFDEGKNVTEAAFDVGYESVSQFARDYKKMFGNSPSEDIDFMKGVLKK